MNTLNCIEFSFFSLFYFILYFLISLHKACTILMFIHWLMNMLYVTFTAKILNMQIEENLPAFAEK